MFEPTGEHVVLVDDLDREVGTMEKLEAHVKGIRHRAFSVLLFNEKGEHLLQRRASDKYHSGGLWSNACCSHPRPTESITQAAERRLEEELGLKAHVAPAFFFEYREELDNALVEHELDHVLIGKIESFGPPNPEEVSEMKFISEENLLADIEKNPQDYTAWFKILMFDHLEKINKFK